MEPWRLTRWCFDTLDKLLTFLQKWNTLLCFPYSEFADYFWKVMTCHGVYKMFTGSRVSDIKWRGWVYKCQVRIIDRCPINWGKINFRSKFYLWLFRLKLILPDFLAINNFFFFSFVSVDENLRAFKNDL